MFGLESGKNKNEAPEALFDLEQDVKDSKKLEDLHVMVLERIQTIKGMLQSGEKKEDYNKLGTLLYGYMAWLSVAERAAVTKDN
jgi:hypothetical protein